MNIEFKTEKESNYKDKIYKFVHDMFVIEYWESEGYLKKELKDISNMEIVYDRKNGYFFFCINQKDKIVGTISLLNQAGQWYVKKFYVENSYRNMGIGSKLYNMLEKKASELEIEKIYLYVRKQLVKTQDMYRKWGYVESKKQEYNHKIHMLKDLRE